MRYSRKVIVGFIVLLAALMSPRLVFGDDDLVRVTPLWSKRRLSLMMSRMSR